MLGFDCDIKNPKHERNLNERCFYGCIQQTTGKQPGCNSRSRQPNGKQHDTYHVAGSAFNAPAKDGTGRGSGITEAWFGTKFKWFERILGGDDSAIAVCLTVTGLSIPIDSWSFTTAARNLSRRTASRRSRINLSTAEYRTGRAQPRLLRSISSRNFVRMEGRHITPPPFLREGAKRMRLAGH